MLVSNFIACRVSYGRNFVIDFKFWSVTNQGVIFCALKKFVKTFKIKNDVDGVIEGRFSDQDILCRF